MRKQVPIKHRKITRFSHDNAYVIKMTIRNIHLLRREQYEDCTKR